MRAQIETPEIMSGVCQVLFESFDIRRADRPAGRCLLFSNVKVCFRVENVVLVMDWVILKHEWNLVPTPWIAYVKVAWDRSGTSYEVDPDRE